MLYYGEYAGDGQERSVYVIYNMYWETKSFDLPNLPKGKEWRVMIDSYDNTFDASFLKKKRKIKASKSMKKAKKQMGLQRKTVVPPRSIVIFVEDNA